MIPSVTFIYNPNAGPRRWPIALRRLRGWWEQRGWQARLEPTMAPGHATELAAGARARGESLVVAIGGDGTLNEIASGLIDGETTLGLIPAGTGNSFARELGLPHSLSGYHLFAASLALLGGRVQAADVIRCASGRSFLLWAGVGLDAHMISKIEPRSRVVKRLGKAGFLASAFWHLPSFRPRELTIRVDEQELTASLLQVLICNCRFWGGGNIPINPDGVMDDGRLEVWCFSGKRPESAFYFTYQSWRRRHAALPGVTMLAGREVEIFGREPTPLHVDAEPAGETPISAAVMPGSLRLLVPDSTPAGLFASPGVPLASFLVEKRPNPK